MSSSPGVVERLAAACQIVAGESIAWCEPPEDDAVLSYFGGFPDADSQVEAILIRSIVAEFLRRLGMSVHARFHLRYSGPDCGLRLPSLESSTHEPIRLAVAATLRDWLARYRHEFEAAHATAAQRARRYLEHHFRENITSSRLAKNVGIERRTLDRQFRAEIGMTVTEYRTRLRVIDALPAVRAGAKADAIALDVGWQARKDLYRGLRTVTGVGPTEIREMPAEQLEQTLDRVRLRDQIRARTH